MNLLGIWRVTASTVTLLVACLLAILTVPVGAQNVELPALQPATSYDEAISKWAGEQNNPPAAEYYLRQALQFGPPNKELCGFILERLSASISRQQRAAEALPFAWQAWQARGFPSDLARVLESAADVGDLPTARQAARILEGKREKWGDDSKRIQDAINRVSTVVIRCIGNVPASRYPGESVLTVQPGAAKTPTQEILSMTVEGAASWREKVDSLGNRYLEITRSPGQPFKTITTVRMRPFAYREALTRYDSSPLPDEVKKFLGKSEWLNPDTPLVRGIVSKLVGNNPVETAANIHLWFARNMRYDGDGMANHEQTDVILTKRRGHCEHLAGAEAALMRAAGVPTRLLRGWNCGEGHPTQHTICEFYLHGIGWINSNVTGLPGSISPGYLTRYSYAAAGGDNGQVCVFDPCEMGTGKYEPLHMCEIVSRTIEEDSTPYDARFGQTFHPSSSRPAVLPLADNLPGWEVTRGEKPQVKTTSRGERYLTTESAESGGKSVCEIGSPAFAISGAKLRFKVAGSSQRYASGLPQSYVGLEVDDKVVLQACGEGDGELREVAWDVSKWKGKQARLVIVDKSRNGQAPFVMVGEVTGE